MRFIYLLHFEHFFICHIISVFDFSLNLFFSINGPNSNPKISPFILIFCHFTKLFMFLFLYNYINTVKRERGGNTTKQKRPAGKDTQHIYDLWMIYWNSNDMQEKPKKESLFYLCSLSIWAKHNKISFFSKTEKFIL